MKEILILASGASVWKDRAFFERPIETMGVNSVITTDTPLDHAFMGDGQFLAAYMSPRTTRPITHTIHPHSADIIHRIPDKIRAGGSGLYAAWSMARMCDRVYLAGYDLGGGYFFDPANSRRSDHSGLVSVWRDVWSDFEGRVIPLSGPLTEFK